LNRLLPNEPGSRNLRTGLLSTAWEHTESTSTVAPIPLTGAVSDDLPLSGLLARLALLAAGPDAARLPDEAAAAAVSQLGAHVGIVRALSADGQSFVVTAVAGPSPVMTQGLIGSYSPVTHVLSSVPAGSALALDFNDTHITDHLVANEYWTFEQLGIRRALIIPLFAGGRLVGRFDLARTSDEPFAPDFEARAGLLAATVAPALNADRLTAESQEATVHRAVFGLYQQVEHLADPRTILQAAVELALREPGCDRAYAMLWNDDRREFVPIAVAGIEARLVEMLKMISLSPQVVPAIDRMMHSGETIIVHDAASSTLLPRSLADALGTRAAMFVPLRGRRHRTLGFLLLDYIDETRHFTEADERVMAGMAPPLSTMIENAMLYEDVVASSDSLAVINEIGIQLAMLTDEESLFRQLHRQVGSVVDATFFALGLLAENRQQFDLRVASDGAFHRLQTHFVAGNDAIARAVQLGRGSLSGSRESTAPDQWAIRVEGSELCHSQMTVPISVGRNVVGAMTVRSPYRHAYGPHDLSVFGAIGVHTGVALENARLYRIVQERGDRRAAVLDQVLQQQEIERKQLVDDIHDNTLQTLAACLFSLDHANYLVEASGDTDVLVDQLESVRTQLADNIDRLRKRIFAVRPATLDILGLKPALNELFTALREQSDITVNLEVRLPGRLAPEIETAVYRLIQEALSLLVLPGRAGIISVRLRGNAEQVVVTLNDQQGRPTAAGLEGDHMDISMLALIERTELLGGSVRHTRKAGGGTTMQITLPINDARSSGDELRTGTPSHATDGHGGR
jgi:signal transduction histidine kinase